MYELFRQFTVNYPLMVAVLVYWIVIGGLVGAAIGGRKNRMLLGFFSGITLNLIGWIYIAIVADRRPACFDCGRKLVTKESQFFCKHCGKLQARSVSGIKDAPGKLAASAKNSQSSPPPIPRYVVVEKTVPVPAESGEDIVLKLMRNHKNIKENVDVLKSFPRVLDSEKQWKQMSRIEKYFSDNLKQHFELEETVLFPKIISTHGEDEVKNTIKTLVQEHRVITAKMDGIGEMIAKCVFPLHKEEIEEINRSLGDIMATMLAHAKIEDEKIFSLEF